MIEQDLSQLHIGLLHQFKVLDYNRFLKAKVQNKYPSTLQLLINQIIPQKELSEDIYQLFNSQNSTMTKILSKLDFILTENYYQGVSPYQVSIHFLKLVRGMILEGYPQALTFVFSVIWTYGFYIEEKRLEEILKEVSMPPSQSGKKQLMKMTSEPG